MNAHLFPLMVALNAAAIAVAVFVVGRDYPRPLSRAMTIFGVGKLITALAFALAALRGVAPDWLTIVVTDTVGVVGLYSNYATARELQGKKQYWPIVAGALLVFVAATYVFAYIPHDLRGAQATTSVAGLLIMGLLTYELLFRYQRAGRAHFICGILTLVIAAVLAARFAHALMTFPIPIADFAGDPFEEVFEIGILFGATTGTVTLVLMSNDEFNARLTHLIGVDPLTGVANRRRLFERGDEEFSRAQRFKRSFSVMLVDIDHFKTINDKWGHATGDIAIKAMAECCQGAVRDVDVVGRLGGEEFVVVMPDTDRPGAADVAERLRRNAAAMGLTDENGSVVPVTVSVGVATLSGDDSFGSLLVRADHAMYQAKSDGRDRVRISDVAAVTA